MIKTKSISDQVDPSDGKRVLVMRFWPRAHSKEHLCLTEWRPDLGSSKQLLRDWYARNISWDQYAERYLTEMQDQQSAIAELAQTAKTETITLLCIEPETNPHCHRHLLKQLIEQTMQTQNGTASDAALAHISLTDQPANPKLQETPFIHESNCTSTPSARQDPT